MFRLQKVLRFVVLGEVNTCRSTLGLEPLDQEEAEIPLRKEWRDGAKPCEVPLRSEMNICSSTCSV